MTDRHPAHVSPPPDQLAVLVVTLTAAAAGVTVVNIDNGFGAAYAASLMNRRES